MAVTASFNEQMKQLNVYQTGADAYLFSGANFWNHADTDAGYSLPSFWERLTVGRDYVYDSTTSRLHSSGVSRALPFSQSPRARAPHLVPPPGAEIAGLRRFEHGRCRAAVRFGPCVRAARVPRLRPRVFLCAGDHNEPDGLIPRTCSRSSTGGLSPSPPPPPPPLLQWAPSDPDAAAIEETYRNWTAYYVAHRPTFLGHASLHLRRPTSRAYEATAFLLNAADAAAAGSAERALAVLYNPALAPASDTLELSLYYAGFAPGAAVVVSRVFPGAAPPVWVLNATVGEGGAAEAYSVLVPFALPPRSYAMFSVSAA